MAETDNMPWREVKVHLKFAWDLVILKNDYGGNEQYALQGGVNEQYALQGGVKIFKFCLGFGKF